MKSLARVLRGAAPAEWRPERLTRRAKKALHLAAEESQRLQQPLIGTPHILLGLIREGDGAAATVLLHHGIDLARTREAVAALTAEPHAEPASSARVSPSAERVVERAQVEARALEHRFVGTEHLLLALLHEDEAAARNMLTSLGAQPDEIRAELLSVISESGRRAESSAGPKDHVVTCRVEDAALKAIDALVEAGIRSTRSDAAAWLIRSGVEANRDFFDQVNATVAEIRRLREQAQALARKSAS
jgi:ATP-dependent Clp protease ATP-binding subunit ClpA